MTGLLIRDVGRVSIDDMRGAETLTGEQRDVLASYLGKYADTYDDGNILCPGCGAKIHGPLAFGQALGVYSMQWGIAHGEAFCTGRSWDDDETCGWPITVYHRVKVPGREEPIRFDTPLPVHPDALLEAASS